MADYESWRIAGYDWHGDWRDVEHGAPEPESYDLQFIDDLVIAVKDDDGVDHYYHIDGPFEDFDSLESYIDDELGDKYGGDWS